MATRDITARIAEATLAAEGLITVKIYREDPAIYFSQALGDPVTGVRANFPNQSVNVQGSTILRLLDIPTLRDADDGAGYYVAMRGSMANWGAAILWESDDDTADYQRVLTVDQAAPIGFAQEILPIGEINTLDHINTLEIELIGGTLESLSLEEMLKGETAYLIGSEIILSQNVTQISATRWSLDGPMVRGYKGTEWAMATHVLGERAILLRQVLTFRVNDELAKIGQERQFKAVSSGMSITNAQAVPFTNTGISLKPWAPVDIRGLADIGDDIQITFKRRSRLQGRNGRDFYDPPLAEATESYELDILTDDESAVLRTLTSTTEAFTYDDADQITDFGGLKGSNLHINIYQLSAEVGRGYPGHAVIHPSGADFGAFEILFQDGNVVAFEDGESAQYEH